MGSEKVPGALPVPEVPPEQGVLSTFARFEKNPLYLGSCLNNEALRIHLALFLTHFLHDSQ